jgi:nucleoid DNA-binding protein
MANEKAAPMNRADIVGAIAAKFEITQKQADEIAREYEAAILRAVSGGQEVRLNGFGSFKVQERAARTGRNPATGEEQEFPAKRVPKFTPSKAMKDALAATGAPAEAKPAAKAAEAPAAEAKPAKAPAKKAAAKKK